MRRKSFRILYASTHRSHCWRMLVAVPPWRKVLSHLKSITIIITITVYMLIIVQEKITLAMDSSFLQTKMNLSLKWYNSSEKRIHSFSKRSPVWRSKTLKWQANIKKNLRKLKNSDQKRSREQNHIYRNLMHMLKNWREKSKNIKMKWKKHWKYIALMSHSCKRMSNLGPTLKSWILKLIVWDKRKIRIKTSTNNYSSRLKRWPKKILMHSRMMDLARAVYRLFN